MQIQPYIPLSKPLRGADDARQFDGDVFDAHPSITTYCRPLVEEFDSSIDGILRGGFLTNSPNDRQPEPLSKGAASRLLYDVRQ